MPPPGSWFYKLRRGRGGDAGEPPGSDRAPATVTTPTSSASASSRGVPEPPPCTPNRASYYVPSGERGAVKGIPPKRRDTQFPLSPRETDIVFDVVTVSRAAADRFDGLNAMPELKLRPILTKPAAGKKADGEGEASGSGSASPTARARRRRPRVHAKPSGGRKGSKPVDAQPAATATAMPGRRRARRRRRRWLQETLLVVKESADPEEDFLASMAEMIAANDEVRASPRGLEELLACYLALNAAEHHRAIVAAFRRAWLDDARAHPHRRLQAQAAAAVAGAGSLS
ncbi:Transcription repressor OFP1 [Hordeum vulgare]|nr:Transcription repressor OFP1 [Hordeum vulgare]